MNSCTKRSKEGKTAYPPEWSITRSASESGPLSYSVRLSVNTTLFIDKGDWMVVYSLTHDIVTIEMKNENTGNAAKIRSEWWERMENGEETTSDHSLSLSLSLPISSLTPVSRICSLSLVSFLPYPLNLCIDHSCLAGHYPYSPNALFPCFSLL